MQVRRNRSSSGYPRTQTSQNFTTDFQSKIKFNISTTERQARCVLWRNWNPGTARCSTSLLKLPQLSQTNNDVWTNGEGLVKILLIARTLSSVLLYEQENGARQKFGLLQCRFASNLFLTHTFLNWCSLHLENIRLGSRWCYDVAAVEGGDKVQDSSVTWPIWDPDEERSSYWTKVAAKRKPAPLLHLAPTLTRVVCCFLGRHGQLVRNDNQNHERLKALHPPLREWYIYAVQ